MSDMMKSLPLVASIWTDSRIICTNLRFSEPGGIRVCAGDVERLLRRHALTMEPSNTEPPGEDFRRLGFPSDFHRHPVRKVRIVDCSDEIVLKMAGALRRSEVLPLQGPG